MSTQAVTQPQEKFSERSRLFDSINFDSLSFFSQAVLFDEGTDMILP
jgi:hypothetical protein